MKAEEAKELFRSRTKEFFQDYEVVFANQSRTAKPTIPLVTLRFGNVKRPYFSTRTLNEGIIEGHYLSRISVTVDLFTNGSPVKDDEDETVAYANTAIDEMLTYCDFINSPQTVDWCTENNISIGVEGDAQDMTGIVNDNNYEYRAKQEMFLYYMHDTGTSFSNEYIFDRTEITAGE